MAQAYYFQGKRVNREWHAVLTAASKEISFRLNSGWRTLAEQTYLWNGYRRGLPGFNLAARPDPNAPHIRYAHALDVNSPDGGTQRLMAWLRRHGVSCALTVPGESWHIGVLDWPALVRLSRRVGSSGDPVIRKGSTNRAAITRLQKLLRGLKLTEVVNGKYGIWTRRAVRTFQKKHGLKVDGVVGPTTWRAIRKAQG